MEFIPVRTGLLTPPQDSLAARIKDSMLDLVENDIIAIASKVVAIDEGRCVAKDADERIEQKDALAKADASLFLPRSEVPGEAVSHTVTHRQLTVSAGIDPFGDYYVLWPEDPMQSAVRWCEWFKAEYGLSDLGVIITDSKSTPLRRGVVGGAIAWAGFDPLYDNRSRIDLMGNKSGGSQINIADAVAAGAVLAMGEGNEQTPLVIARNVPYITETYQAKKAAHTSYEIPLEEDIFAPFFGPAKWEQGGANNKD